GTYLLNIVKNKRDVLSINLHDIASAYEVWINERLAAKCGKIGKGKDSETPEMCNSIIPLSNDSNITIAIEVSNYNYIFGGMDNVPTIGKSDRVFKTFIKDVSLDVFIIGILFAISIYHLILFMFRTKSKVLLSFGLFNFDWVIKMMFEGDGSRVIKVFFPDCSYEFMIGVITLAIVFSVPLFLFFLKSILPDEVSMKIVYLSVFESFLMLLAVIFAEPYIHQIVLIYGHFIFASVLIIYVFYVLVSAVKHNREGAGYILIGWIIFASAGIIDFLTGMDIIMFPWVLQWGFVTMSIMFAAIVASVFSNALDSQEILTEELILKNLELEKNMKLEQDLYQQTLKTKCANLQMLRYQLNPHFLFNALASMRGAVIESPQTAYEMISSLSSYCRHILTTDDNALIPVEKEIQFIDAFLNMEMLRMGEYLKAEISIDEDIKDFKVPAFFLQPIVENAIKHGSRSSSENLSLKVLIKNNNNNGIVVQIINSGYWIDENSLNNNFKQKDVSGNGQGFSIGIDNMLKRLESVFGDGFSFCKSDDNGNVVVEIEIKAKANKELYKEFSND
ncbi:MAG: histidine kinase, partial [Deltaproteobacteria bacterium]|nr:histidine kinase [Deltaproteobacteria bacterium]